MKYKRIFLISPSILMAIFVLPIITCQNQSAKDNDIMFTSNQSSEDKYFVTARGYYFKPESDIAIFNYANQEYILGNFQISSILWKKLLSRSTITDDAVLSHIYMSLSDCCFQTLSEDSGKIYLLNGVSCALKTTKPVLFPPYTYEEYVNSIKEYQSTRSLDSIQYKNLLISRLRWAVHHIRHHQFLIDNTKNNTDYIARYRANLETMDKHLYEIANSKIDLSGPLDFETIYKVTENP